MQMSFLDGHDKERGLSYEKEQEPKRQRRSSLLRGIGHFWKRPHEAAVPIQGVPIGQLPFPDYFPPRRAPSLPDVRRTRRAIPSLPRPQTFRREQSERRNKLLEVEPSLTERRATSVVRRRALSASVVSGPCAPAGIALPSRILALSPTLRRASPHLSPTLALAIEVSEYEGPTVDVERALDVRVEPPTEYTKRQSDEVYLPPPVIPPQWTDLAPPFTSNDDVYRIDPDQLRDDYEQRWILNLSMSFRDKSHREKFFVTYAEHPTKWRRLTVSLDYRVAPEDSLEADLAGLHYQRDKSLRIYEAIRESLLDIQFYSTVTNLKLETTPSDGQLHVHVREDANEVIHYPSMSLFAHIDVPSFSESEVEFVSHLSGFVYKVRVANTTMIKKEIPGPDTIDEFLYEVNALNSLLECESVVQLLGLVTDDGGSVVKGLLLSYASQGALVDMLYDYHGAPELSWRRREKWARQIVAGLAGIHEAGFVQGDFTLSNIVIDSQDDAQVIDINRRGCPVGWEPPELGKLIDSGQRVGMCIGVKTDLYQLGMVLWALAESCDEPEHVPRPLPEMRSEVPAYYRKMVDTCLSDRPQGRESASRILRAFPVPSDTHLYRDSRSPAVEFEIQHSTNNSLSTSHRSDKEYIDPRFAVTLDEVRRPRSPTVGFGDDLVSYVDPDPLDSVAASTSYHFESTGSWVGLHRRGRSRRRSSSAPRWEESSATSVSLSAGSGEVIGRRVSARCYADSVDAERGEYGKAYANHGPEQICAPLDKRLAGVQFRSLMGSLLHTDSGFDEHMVEESAPTEKNDGEGLVLGHCDTLPTRLASHLALPEEYGE